jgi:hypothetical protein
VDVPARYGFAPEIGGAYPFVENVIEAYNNRNATV